MDRFLCIRFCFIWLGLHSHRSRVWIGQELAGLHCYKGKTRILNFEVLTVYMKCKRNKSR